MPSVVPSGMRGAALAVLARRSALISPRLGLRRLAAQANASGGGIGVKTAVVGMAGAAGLGIGIGLMLPVVVGGSGESEPDDAQEKGRPQDRRKSTVYESVSKIASNIERPAMVQDASRALVLLWAVP